ncbi:MAG: hypothetical protein WB715_27360 [Roseiarcus sp.]
MRIVVPSLTDIRQIATDKGPVCDRLALLGKPEPGDQMHGEMARSDHWTPSFFVNRGATRA